MKMDILKFCQLKSMGHKLGLTIGIYFFVLVCFYEASLADILHLELGAANYSLNEGDSTNRFRVLEQTLENLIKEYGTIGTIYLNDIDSEALNVAVLFAQTWLFNHQFNEIQIVPLPGDYNRISLPQVKTMHLKNPGHSQLGINRISGPIVRGLENAAAHSKTGLLISTYFYKEEQNFISNLSRFGTSQFVLVNTNEVSPYYYFLADGRDPQTAFPELKTTTPYFFILKERSLHFKQCSELFAL